MSLEDPVVAKPVEEEEVDDEEDEGTSEDGSSDDDDDSKEDDDDDTKEDDDDDDNSKEEEDDDDSKEEDDDDDDDEPIAVPVVVPKPVVPAPTLNRQPPKMRIKLSLKLPTKANAAAAKKDSKTDPSSDGDAVATVVHDDDDDKKSKTTAVAVATTTTSTAATKTSKPKSAPAKRRSAHPSRQIRLPPIASPGPLMAPPSQGNSKTNNGNSNIPVETVANSAGGLVTPNAVFGSSMSAAGYTVEHRTKTPHRGSSVTRTVGDLFDSNVKMTLHFPPLLKPEYLSKDSEKSQALSPAEMLLASLSHHVKGNRGKKRPRTFEDMVPVSLTIPYPESFLEKRSKYVEEVENRERKIVAFQEAREEEEEEASTTEETPKKDPVVIPPIPEPPEPPTLQELEGFPTSVSTAATSTSTTSSLSAPFSYAEDKHPIYLPRKKEFCAHLDPECFHITEGRYFGLLSNFVADPNYVGANAPGISGVHASGGAGLATSTAGSGTGGLALTVSASYHQGAAPSKSDKKKMAASPMLSMMDRSSHGDVASVGTSLPSHSGEGSGNSIPPAMTTKPRRLGPKPTATATDLRKIMDEGGDLAEALRTCITRAAVHASRSGRHGQSFLAPNGETYPDVSKAFAAHAEIKPCQRCKGNKQGAYHCRLRRRHKDPDFDGGSSLAALDPLFVAPMESLLCSSKRSQGGSK